METRSFNLMGDGELRGFIFVNRNNSNFPGRIVGVIWPFDRSWAWINQGVELVGRDFITADYDMGASDEDIVSDLLDKASIHRSVFTSFQITAI